MVTSYTALRTRMATQYENVLRQTHRTKDGLLLHFSNDVQFSSEDIRLYNLHWIDREKHTALCSIPGESEVLKTRCLPTTKYAFKLRVFNSIIREQLYRAKTPAQIAEEVGYKLNGLNGPRADYWAIDISTDIDEHLLANNTYIKGKNSYRILFKRPYSDYKSAVDKDSLIEILIAYINASNEAERKMVIETYENQFALSIGDWSQFIKGEIDVRG